MVWFGPSGRSGSVILGEIGCGMARYGGVSFGLEKAVSAKVGLGTVSRALVRAFGPVWFVKVWPAMT